MEREDATEEEVVRVLDSCISHIKWRLRPSSRSRLQTDVLALCTRLRPVVMVDYGGKIPELQENLCLLIHHCQKESSIFRPLRVMVIEDMIYLIHVEELTEYVQPSLDSQWQMIFVDLEQDPPKMVTQPEQNSVAMQLLSIQKSFSSLFAANQANKNILPEASLSVNGREIESAEKAGCKLSHSGEPVASESSEVIDLSNCILDNEVTLPTLNGWLLGYPVVYLSSKERMVDAVYNLSSKPLNLFKIVVGRNNHPTKGPCQEELMSFSVPYDLSMGGENEPWAKAFLARMRGKFERCKSWMYLRMEVNECYPLSVAL